LLLLDEPSSGLSVEETEDMAFWIQDIRTLLGITVLMVEHDMSLVSAVSDRVLALNYGRPIALGTAREVQDHPDVIKAYLGRCPGPRDGVRILPGLEGARRAARRPAVRRRAADALDQPRPDGATDDDAAGRAVAGPRAQAREGHLRHHRPDQPRAGRDRPARGAAR